MEASHAKHSNHLEKPSKQSNIKVFGFIQPEWQSTDGTKLKLGKWQGQLPIYNGQRPNFNEASQANIFRARLGSRGRVNEYLNFSLLTEFGNGLLNKAAKQDVMLLDAAINASFAGVHLKVGQFKYPGSEEAQQAKYDYVNFAFPSAQLVLESFFDGAKAQNSTDDNARNGSPDAFRDFGVQLMKIHRVKDWEHSFAVMLGNGNGLMRGDDNAVKDVHVYWSSEKVFSGKGRKQDGLKLFAWHRQGKRTLTAASAGEYERIRSGVGLTYKHKKWRSTLEFIDADGMIYSGSQGGALPGSQSNDGSAVSYFKMSPESKANGWWADVSYRVSKPIELLARYSFMERGTESLNQVDFTNTTLGLNWHYAKKSKLLVNYEWRSFEAPKQGANPSINAGASAMDNKLSIQLFHFFSL